MWNYKKTEVEDSMDICGRGWYWCHKWIEGEDKVLPKN